MKRHSSWKIYTGGSLKVKQYTTVITKRLIKGCLKDLEESSAKTSYHVRVEVDSNSEA